MSLRGHIYASNISLLFIHLRPVVLHAFIQVFSRIFLRPDLNHRNRISCTCDANIAGTTCHHFPSLSRAPYCRCVPSCPTDHPLRTGRRNVGKTYIVFCLLNRNSDRPQLLWDVGRCGYSLHCFWKKTTPKQPCIRFEEAETAPARWNVLTSEPTTVGARFLHHLGSEFMRTVNNYRPHLLSSISANIIIIFEVEEGKSVAITHAP